MKPNTIQHEHLSEDQLNRITKLHKTFAEVDKSSLETWVDNFKRDANPESEISVWERVARAYTKSLLKISPAKAQRRKVHTFGFRRFRVQPLGCILRKQQAKLEL